MGQSPENLSDIRIDVIFRCVQFYPYYRVLLTMCAEFRILPSSVNVVKSCDGRMHCMYLLKKREKNLKAVEPILCWFGDSFIWNLQRTGLCRRVKCIMPQYSLKLTCFLTNASKFVLFRD